MKKILFIFILASSLTFAGSFAQLGLGLSKGDNSDNHITAFGSLNVLGNLGARLEYTKNITKNPAFSSEDISRYGLFATYTLTVLPNVSLTPKVGLVKTDGSFKLFETIYDVSHSSTGFTFGLEANYELNENMSIFVGYTDYGKSLDIKNIDKDKLDTANYTFGIKINL